MNTLKNIWKVRTNKGDFIVIKAKQEQLKSLYKQNKIREHTDVAIRDITKEYLRDIVL